jgi:hypothetical protein
MKPWLSGNARGGRRMASQRRLFDLLVNWRLIPLIHRLCLILQLLHI